MYKDNLKLTSSMGTTLYIPENIIEKERKDTFLENMIITKIGYFKEAKRHAVERPGINEYIMLYCIEGNGWLRTDEMTKLISKGNLVLLESNTPHAYGAAQDNPWSIYWVHFIGKGIADIFYRLEISKQSPIVQVGVRAELSLSMEVALRTLSNGYSFSDLFHASSTLQNFFSNILQIKTYSHLQATNNINLEDLILFMKSNIQEVYTLEQLADKMCMSKYHFSRKFKERTGYSPIDYFTRMKIQKACELLETSLVEIKVISEYLSFSTPYYFSEVFKKITGYSPKNYRKKYGLVL
ncbi:transcriptional regulator [Anaerocolumna cellulosilytica]|uniref:Transcriptional regulator n=1 Tax=Anaerocolumna cellulosilytica TaxID=433286 RepID=A0A6S6QY81_9FIRM|nr:AraC family transcriptional regulator [Anaerocolumna cellulosilytica]MBB5194088.1 AraC-like DNA-binding protein [Anaerocolumna cellulosilytica]BCJ94696.1 transcriptional regulator [Anaerocolumna cellulosilytica]